jgi:hypothetical protein
MVRIDLKQTWNGQIVKTQCKKVSNKSAYETGLIVEGYAKELAARRYGYLAASFNTQSISEGTELDNPSKYAKEKVPINHDVKTFRKISKPNIESETLVGTAVDYSWYPEFGTIYQDAQPALRPALEMAKGEVLEIVKINSKKYFLNYLIEHEQYLQSRGK